MHESGRSTNRNRDLTSGICTVSKTESIEVTDDDIEAKYQELADERGQSVEAIRGYFVKENSVEDLRSRLLEERTLDWLLEQSKLVDAPAEVEAPATESAPAADAAPAASGGEADLSILKGTVGAFKEALSTGDHDAYLDALLEAEEAGKARKGVLQAIRSRQ